MRPILSSVCLPIKLLPSHVSMHFPRPGHGPQVLKEPVSRDQYLHNVPVTGRGLPSVYWVFQRFRTCGAKQLRGVVFIIKFDQCLSFSVPRDHLWLVVVGGGGSCRPGPQKWPHAERRRAALSLRGAKEHFTAHIVHGLKTDVGVYRVCNR